jgi:hypothetical protein
LRVLLLLLLLDLLLHLFRKLLLLLHGRFWIFELCRQRFQLSRQRFKLRFCRHLVSELMKPSFNRRNSSSSPDHGCDELNQKHCQ